MPANQRLERRLLLAREVAFEQLRISQASAIGQEGRPLRVPNHWVHSAGGHESAPLTVVPPSYWVKRRPRVDFFFRMPPKSHEDPAQGYALGYAVVCLFCEAS
jgi:hypothetical protein